MPRATELKRGRCTGHVVQSSSFRVGRCRGWTAFSSVERYAEVTRSVGTHTSIVITGRNDAPQLVECLRAGADEYATKPLGVGELEARLDAVRRVATVHRTIEDNNVALRIDAARRQEAQRGRRADPFAAVSNRLRITDELEPLERRA